ncbi:zinc finger protein-like [Tropilaelaps mercedesae]|uniref:Zinc finger protein-like n=1 Tax=Tropilaelaps mercedesae TaxID=418985 RepID=A0A1V9XGQ3_9ACAR|nr:zinc finger protein-like [Tropilaelaps mercedesae]
MPTECLKSPKEPIKLLYPCSTVLAARTGASTPLDETSLAANTVPTFAPEIVVRTERPDNIIPVDNPKPGKNQLTQIRKLWRPFEANCSHPQPHRAFRCFCGSAFARNEELTRHLRIHSGQRPFECNQCGRRFGRKDHRDKHLKTHLRNEYKRVHRCPVGQCLGRYTRTDALNRHMLAAHGFRRPRKRTTQKTKDHEVPALLSGSKAPIIAPPLPMSAHPACAPQLRHIISLPLRIPQLPSSTTLTTQAMQATSPLCVRRDSFQIIYHQQRSQCQFSRDFKQVMLQNDIYPRSHFELAQRISAQQYVVWQRWLR